MAKMYCGGLRRLAETTNPHETALKNINVLAHEIPYTGGIAIRHRLNGYLKLCVYIYIIYIYICNCIYIYIERER